MSGSPIISLSPSPIGVNIQGKTPQQEAAQKKQEDEKKTNSTNPTSGYNEASRRAAAAAESDKRIRKGGGFDDSPRQPRIGRNDPNAKQKIDDYEAALKAEARSDADRLIKDQMQKAKETPGAQSFYTRVNLDTGEVRIRETSRGIRSGVPERQYTTEYANPNLNQVFGTKRVGDILRKEAARDDAALMKADSIPEFGDILQRQTTRRYIDNEAAKEFSRQYGQYQLNEIEGRRGLADAGIAVPKKGGSIIEEVLPTGEILTYARPRLQKHYYVDIGNEKITYGSQPDIETPKGGVVEGFTNYFGNIGEFAVSGGGLIREPSYKPEPEGQALGALFGFGSRAVKGQPFETNIVLFSKEIGDVGRQIEKNPLYATGSLLGTAAFTAATFGFGTAARYGSRGIRYVSEAVRNRRLPRGYVPTESRPFEIRPRLQYEYTPKSDYDPFGTGWYTRDEIGKRIVERQQAFLKEIERAEEFKDPIGSRFAPRDITKFRAPEERGIEGFGGRVQSTFKTITKQFQKEQTEADKIAAELEKDAARLTEAEKTQKGISDVAKAQKRAEALTKTEPALDFAGFTAPGATKARSRPLGLGGGSNLFRATGALGIGGLTGAERVRRRRVDESLEFSLVYPQTGPSDIISQSTRGELGSILSTDLRDIVMSGIRSGPRQSQGLRINVLEITGLDNATILDSGLAQDQSLKELTQLDSMLDTSLGVEFQPALDTPLRESLKIEHQPRGLPFNFGFDDDKRKRRGKKGKRVRYRKATFSTADLIRDIGYGKQGSRSFQSRYGRY